MVSHHYFTDLSNIAAATFSRHDGASEAPYASRNVGFHVGDDPESVLRNRQRIKEELGLSLLVSTKQVHGDNILILGQRPKEDVEYEGYDALITSLPGIGLMIQQADCQAIMLFDPENGAVANIHAGWRGSVANILAKTVAAMSKSYGSRSKELFAAISPSLGPCCGEFINYRTELPPAFHPYQAKPAHFDFWAISRDQLITCGLRVEQIEIARRCTVCDLSYFSYRRENNTGRFASVIALAAP